MSRELVLLALLGMLVVVPAPLLAAEISDPPTTDELTLRPGDKITFSPQTVHRIRFGGKVRPSAVKFPTNNNVQLHSFATIKKVLDFAPMTPDFQVTGDIAKAGQAQKVVATVKADAHTQGVSEISFTCGFNDSHADDMVTISFKIAAPLPPPAPPAPAPAARNVEITSTNNPPPPNHRFLLKTSAGEKSLTLKP
jgi:hypothetical protein